MKLNQGKLRQTKVNKGKLRGTKRNKGKLRFIFGTKWELY